MTDNEWDEAVHTTEEQIRVALSKTPIPDPFIWLAALENTQNKFREQFSEYLVLTCWEACMKAATREDSQP